MQAIIKIFRLGLDIVLDSGYYIILILGLIDMLRNIASKNYEKALKCVFLTILVFIGFILLPNILLEIKAAVI